MYYDYDDLAFPGEAYEQKVCELAASYNQQKTVTTTETPYDANARRGLLTVLLSLFIR
jgi:hypothetical protein